MGLYGKHEPTIFSFIRHCQWPTGAHDEEKRETSESIYCNKCSTRKLGTSEKRSTQSAQSAWFAFQHECGRVISGLRITFPNKFRQGGGKAKVLITSTILKAK